MAEILESERSLAEKSVEVALQQNVEKVTDRINSAELDDRSALELAAESVNLFPNHETLVKERFPFNETLNKISKNSQAALEGEENWGKYIEDVSRLAKLYPERANEIKIPNGAKEAVARDFKIAIDDNKPGEFVRCLKLYREVFPDEVAAAAGMDGADEMFESIDRLAGKKVKDKNWKGLCDLESALRNTFPEKCHDNLVEENRGKIMQELNTDIAQKKPEYYVGFANDARQLGLIG